MKKTHKLLILISFLLILSSSTVQSQQQVFTKVFYDNNGTVTGNAMLKTPDNHILICGEKDNGPMVLKMDPGGNIIWNKQFTPSLYHFYALAPTHDSCFLVGGGCNQRGMFVSKMTLPGDTLWTKVVDLGGYYNELASVQETFNQGLIISGNIYHTTPSYRYDVAITKLDSQGNQTWSKAFTKADEKNLWVTTTKQCPDSGFVVLGTYQALNPYIVENMFVMKLAQDGEVLWVKSPTLTASSHIYGMDLMVEEDGLLILAANYTGMMLIKTDFSGNFIWGKQSNMNSGWQEFHPSHKIHKTSDNGYMFASGMGISKIDSLGNLIWAQDLFLYSVDAIELNDGGYLAMGNGPLLGVAMTETHNPQVGIIKMDSLGASSDCVYSANPNFTDIFLEMESVSFLVAPEEGELISNFTTITDPDISIDSGCVAMTGAVYEYQSHVLKLSAFPNPSTGHFHITVNNMENCKFLNLELFNMMGEKVYETKAPSVFQTGINLQAQPNGIYLIRAILGDGTASGRVIISR